MKEAATSGRFSTGNKGSKCFCEVGAPSGSRIVNAQINAKEAMISNNIGNIEIGMISKIAPIVNTPTINPTDPHFRILP